jgi:hypothetical protein
MVVYSITNLTLLVGLASSALVAAGASKGLIGVGMPIVAMLLVSPFVDLPAAVALLSVPLILGNVRLAAVTAVANRGPSTSWAWLAWAKPFADQRRPESSFSSEVSGHSRAANRAGHGARAFCGEQA